MQADNGFPSRLFFFTRTSGGGVFIDGSIRGSGWSSVIGDVIGVYLWFVSLFSR